VNSQTKEWDGHATQAKKFFLVKNPFGKPRRIWLQVYE